MLKNLRSPYKRTFLASNLNHTNAQQLGLLDQVSAMIALKIMSNWMWGAHFSKRKKLSIPTISKLTSLYKRFYLKQLSSSVSCIPRKKDSDLLQATTRILFQGQIYLIRTVCKLWEILIIRSENISHASQYHNTNLSILYENLVKE